MAKLNLSVIIEAVDRATAPISKIANALRIKLPAALNTSNRLFGRFGQIAGVSSLVLLHKTLPAIGFVSRALGRMIGLAARATGVLAGLGIAAGGAFAQGVFRVGSEYERLTRLLTSTEGSVASAMRALDRIDKFATDNGLAVDVLTAAYLDLRNAGIEPTEQRLVSLSNAAAGANRSVAAAGEALTAAMAGQYGDLEAFGIKSVEIGRRVAFSYDLAGKTIRVQARNNGKAIERALLGIFDEKFAGQLEQQKDSMAGLWAQLMGQLRNFKKSVAGAGVFDFVKGEMAKLLARINVMAANGKLEAWAKQISAGLIELFKSLKDLVSKVDWVAVIRGVIDLANGFAKFMKLVGGFKGLIDHGGAAAIAWLTYAIAGLGYTIAGILGVAAGPVVAVIALIGALGIAAWYVYRNWDKIVGWLGKMWNGLVDVLGAAWKAISGVFKRGADAVWNMLPDWFRKVLTGVGFVVRLAVAGATGGPAGVAAAGAAMGVQRPRPNVQGGRAANGQVGVDVRVHSDGRPPSVRARSNSAQVPVTASTYRGGNGD